MHICCLDLEGVLVPEIWIAVSKKTGLRSLKLTTRDIPDYDQLMQYRIRILKKEGIPLKEIQKVIATMRPLPGADSFLKKLRRSFPVIILSDTFYEFAGPLMNQLGNPTLFCNWLKVNSAGFISGYELRQKDGKRKAVQALHQIGFQIKAAGDSYNDLSMLRTADQGVLFRPPLSIQKKFGKRFTVTHTHAALLKALTK